MQWKKVRKRREKEKNKKQQQKQTFASARCRLVVLGVEVGGCWGSEAASFLRLLARARARAAPEALRLTLQSAYVPVVRCSFA